MGLHKTSMVHGIGAYLEQRGLIGWASEKVASEVYEHIAGQLQGPEQLPAAGLDPSSAYKIAQMISSTHADLARQGYGGDRSLAMQKQAAAQNDVDNLAMITAGELMQKRADAMIMQGGQHTNRPGESPDTLARLDQMQRPQGQYLTGVGNTDMPEGPASWSSQPHPVGHSNTVPVSNSITKGASYNTKQAWAGAANEFIHGPAALARAGWDSAGPMGQNALLGGLGGAALGAGTGALVNEDDRLQGALIGGAGGAALGAGGGALSGSETAVGRAMRQPLLAGGLMAQAAGETPVGRAMSQPLLAAGLTGQAAGHEISQAWNGLGQPARWAAMGGAGGAALGAGAGALAADDGERGQGALMGAGAGALGGAALGAGSSVAAPYAQNAFNTIKTHAGSAMDEIAADAKNQYAYDKALTGGGRTSTASDMSELLRKIASGGSLTNSPKNTAADAAKHDELAALDLKNRAKDKYVGVAGHSSFPNVNQDFDVRHMPGAPKTGPSTVPSREIKSASDLSQDEQLMLAMFNKTAAEVAPYLPTNMPQETKIAHVRRCMGLDYAERVDYLNAIYGQR